MFAIIGLGNPGRKYVDTYHNVGFMTVDKLREELGFKPFKADGKSHVTRGYWEGNEILLLKPDTFMNASGEAAREIVNKHNIDVERELIVIYDDVDVDIGKLRFREEGSAGTHNGMRSVIKELGTQKFLRMRVGTRAKALSDGETALIDFVLSKIPFEERLVIDGAIERAVEGIKKYLSGVDMMRITEKLNRVD